jgi:hypothetical protein
MAAKTRSVRSSNLVITILILLVVQVLGTFSSIILSGKERITAFKSLFGQRLQVVGSSRGLMVSGEECTLTLRQDSMRFFLCIY